MTAILNGPDVANHHTVRAAADEVGSTTQFLKDLGIEAAELAGSSVPGVGAALDAKSFYQNYQAGSWAGMAVDVIGLAPVFGDGAKGLLRGSRISWQTAKAVRRLSQARSKLDVARKAEAARLFRRAQKKSPFEKYQEALAKCDKQECRQKAKEQYKLDRYKRLPQNGTWKGTPGDSKFIPDNGSALEQYMSQKYSGVDGINFKNGEPDFSPFTKEQVTIPNMGRRTSGENVPTDFTQARQVMRERNGSWTTADEKNLTWHHVGDGTTMQLVDSKIHNTATNGGGVAHSGGASMTTDPEY